MAFKSEYETLKSFYDEDKKKLFSEGDNTGQRIRPEEKLPTEELILEKNSLGLTPLIYAIWGEQNRNDGEKKTSKWLFEISNERLKEKMGDAYEKYLESSFPYDFHLKN